MIQPNPVQQFPNPNEAALQPQNTGYAYHSLTLAGDPLHDLQKSLQRKSTWQRLK